MVANPDCDQWYCVYTYASTEREAEQNLRDQQFKTFLPEYRDGYRIRPLFPRYLFVLFNVRRDPWRKVAHTHCVQRILSVNPETPIPLKAEVIEQVRLQSEFMLAPPEAPPEIEPGVELRFRDGRYISLSGICTWRKKERVKVLLQIMGREVEVLCHHREVAVVNAVQAEAAR